MSKILSEEEHASNLPSGKVIVWGFAAIIGFIITALLIWAIARTPNVPSPDQINMDQMRQEGARRAVK